MLFGSSEHVGMGGQLWVSLKNDLTGPFSLENPYVRIFMFCRLVWSDSAHSSVFCLRTKRKKMAEQSVCLSLFYKYTYI